ncbi:hypothetical protein J0H58_37460 [bacterium]|nr:hypothetical protein [bacterium]
MPVWLWIVVGIVVLLGVAVVAFFVWASKTSGRVRADILERGEDTTAWIVDVEPPEGLMWAIALVLVSPDPDVPADTMRALARRVRAVRAKKRKPADRDEATVARLTKKQLDALGRERLPDGFTGGWEVYSAFMDLGPLDEENLPEDALDGESYPVRLIWDEYPTMMVVPPPKRRKKSRRGDD